MLTKKEKIRLLLSPFTEHQFEKFLLGAGFETPKGKKTTLGRWITGKSVPIHPFFKQEEIESFLNKNYQSKDLIVKDSYELLSVFFVKLNPLFNKTVNQDWLEKQLNIIVKSQKTIDYDPIHKMKDLNNPYYQDRFSASFLEAHISGLRKTIGDFCANSIKDRLLKVQNPTSGQTYTFPAVVLTEESNIKLNPELSDRITNVVPDKFIEAVKSSGSKIENNPTFALDQLSIKDGLISCFISDYFNALYQSDNFFYNIVGSYPGLNPDRLERYLASPNMIEWSNQLKNIVLDNNFKEMDTSVGCSCMLSYKTEDSTYQSLLSKKRPDANGFSDLHVIPASMFQPVGNNPLKFEQELDIKLQVFRELAEEVFDYPEVTDAHPNHLIKKMFSHPEIEHLETLLKKGKAEFHVTGIYLDLFRLRPEILTTIIVHDPEWATTHFNAEKNIGNWETEKHGIIAIDLDDNTFFQVIDGKAGFLCAPGAACFVKGYEKFKSSVHNIS